MVQSLPLVLVPGLTCTARLFGPQIAALWPFGQVAVADHRRDEDMAAIAARILKDAPPRFALAGLSMGGYICFAMIRLAPERIAKLALLDTSARPDTPEQAAGRNTQSALPPGASRDAPCGPLRRGGPPAANPILRIYLKKSHIDRCHSASPHGRGAVCS